MPTFAPAAAHLLFKDWILDESGDPILDENDAPILDSYASTPEVVVGGSAPATANLTFSTTAPQLVQTGNLNLTPNAANLLLSSTAPSAAAERGFAPRAAQLLLINWITDQGGDPILDQNDDPFLDGANTPELIVTGNREPAAANLSFSSSAPQLAHTGHLNVTPAAANLLLSSAAPSFAGAASLSPRAAQLLLKNWILDEYGDPILDETEDPILDSDANAPTVVYPLNVVRAPADAQLSLSSTAPALDVLSTVGLVPASANLVLSSVSPFGVVNFHRNPAAANLLISAAAPTIVLPVSYILAPASANLLFSSWAPQIAYANFDPMLDDPDGFFIITAEIKPWVLTDVA